MMKQQLIVFGETLFDCFKTGEQVMGGAPFNAAWHLQVLGDKPQLISRVGKDELGISLLSAMKQWFIKTNWVQVDNEYATGTVQIEVNEGEPLYDIVEPATYDFIEQSELSIEASSLLYRGSLILRNSTSSQTIKRLSANQGVKTFMDVYLRSPWWKKQELLNWLKDSS